MLAKCVVCNNNWLNVLTVLKVYRADNTETIYYGLRVPIYDSAAVHTD